MTISEFEELAAAFNLGALNDAEKQQFASYLNNASEEEQQLMTDFDTVITFIGTSAKPVSPPSQVKDRLLDMVKKEVSSASDSQMRGFSFVFSHEGHWKPFGEGVSAKILYKDPQSHASTMLLRMEAGSQLEGHAHATMEELYLLEGDCHSAGKLLKAGDYHRAEPGSAHNITTTQQGCLMLIISRAS